MTDSGSATTADDDRAVFTISVAAELVGTGVQNLRAYERAGLVTPGRTDGGTRRYSLANVERLRRVTALLASGVNLAGIELVLDLQDDNQQLRDAAAGATRPTGSTARRGSR